MASRVQVLAVVAVLKRRFNNLTAEELLTLAYDVIEAVEANA